MEHHHSANNVFIKSALIISIGGLVSKLLGAVYRIPLTNLLGSYGMGLYQLVFPPYIMIMTLATGGIPIAISKLVAFNNQLNRFDTSKKIFDYSIFILIVSGLIGSFLLFIFAEPLARWQGNVETAAAYRIVAPSILFITVTSGLRGLFQGNMRMLSVSFSQVMEQVAKLTIGLVCARALLPDVVRAVNGAILAVCLSEFVSLCVMLVAFLAKKKDLLPIQGVCVDVPYKKEIYHMALPVLLGGFLLQVAQLLDSIMIVNLISRSDATNLYGLWTGPVNSLLGLPVTLSTGVAVSALPSITRSFASGDVVRLNEKFNSAFKLTLVIALPSALGLAVLAKPVISLLYAGLPQEEIDVASMLLTVSALSIVFLSLLQTMMSALQALNKPYAPVFVLVFAILVKFAFNFLLLPLTNVNIYGAGISETMCYLFAVLGAIIYLKIKTGLNVELMQGVIKPITASVFMMCSLTLLTVFAKEFVFSWAGVATSILICSALYFATLSVLKVFNQDEMHMFAPFKNKGKAQNEIR